MKNQLELSRTDWFNYHSGHARTITIWILDNPVLIDAKHFCKLQGNLKFSLAAQDFRTTEKGVIEL